jgi:hypothetical protein
VTTKTWDGKDGDWFTADHWSPAEVPQAGDKVVIANGEPRIKSGDPAIDDLQVTLGATDFAQPASIKAFGATFGSGFAVTVPRNSPYAALSFENATTFDGTLTAVGGQLSVKTGDGFQGSGATFIEKGATVTFMDAVPQTMTVTFGDANGTLALNDPTKFSAQITDVQPGDRIVLGRLYVAVSASYSRGQLRIFGERGRNFATLNLSEAVSPLNFYASPSGIRGSTLSTSRQRRSWGGGSGDWFDSSLWEDGVPLGATLFPSQAEPSYSAKLMPQHTAFSIPKISYSAKLAAAHRSPSRLPMQPLARERSSVREAVRNTPRIMYHRR